MHFDNNNHHFKVGLFLNKTKNTVNAETRHKL